MLVLSTNTFDSVTFWYQPGICWLVLV